MVAGRTQERRLVDLEGDQPHAAAVRPVQAKGLAQAQLGVKGQRLVQVAAANGDVPQVRDGHLSAPP